MGDRRAGTCWAKELLTASVDIAKQIAANLITSLQSLKLPTAHLDPHGGSIGRDGAQTKDAGARRALRWEGGAAADS
jgi:hypothetical protein